MNGFSIVMFVSYFLLCWIDYFSVYTLAESIIISVRSLQRSEVISDPI